MRIPNCSVCGEKMFKVKDRNTRIVYWDCEKGCIFHHPVWRENLTKNEKKFLEKLR